MKVLITGANGYIGLRLLHKLHDQGHELVCAVRSADRLTVPKDLRRQLEIVEIDFLEDPSKVTLPSGIDAAYYLIHSMSASTSSFDKMEETAAKNFNRLMKGSGINQVIYLSGMVNEEELSKHLLSRKRVEDILYDGDFSVTVLRAGIIVGSGSSSFEIIRDLCEKLPIMVTPNWVNTKTHPIAIRDVLSYLVGVLGKKECYGESYDIGGPDVMSYAEMMRGYASVRELNLTMVNVPYVSPKLSSYWLYFVTSTSYKLAQNLVDSMGVEVIASDQRLEKMLQVKPIHYKKAIRLAFKKIEQNQVVSSWKDSMVSGRFSSNLNEHVEVPNRGCEKDVQSLKTDEPEKALARIWEIGGSTGYYYGDILWQLRGYLDKLFGGVGLRRGRTSPTELNEGDSLDFWRVLLADKSKKRLLLFAEMKIPGEAWLEFKIDDNDVVHQTATFRPKGIWGRLYWYSMLPFHYFIFAGMLKKIARG